MDFKQISTARENTNDTLRGKKLNRMTPPIITTTAATPQDSPKTLEQGMSFSDWDNTPKMPSLLRPPSVVGSVKALNNLLCPDQQPQNKRKMENSINRGSAAIEIETKSSLNNARAEHSDSIKAARPSTGDASEAKTKSKQCSLKKRSSVKKKKEKSKSESDTEILNNGRMDVENAQTNGNKLLKSTKRIQNITKNTNKISPHSKLISTTTESDYYNNSQKFGQYADPQPHPQQLQPQKQQRDSCTLSYRRRMSTMDSNAFHKITNLDMQNIENFQAKPYHGAKSANISDSRKSINGKGGSDTASVHIVVSEPFKFTSKAIQRHIDQFTKGREEYSLYLFAEENRFRQICTWFVTQKWFDNVILLFIALNCITLAMERPNIPPNCPERYFLGTANYVFTVVFTIEMFVKVNLCLI